MLHLHFNTSLLVKLVGLNRHLHGAFPCEGLLKGPRGRRGPRKFALTWSQFSARAGLVTLLTGKRFHSAREKDPGRFSKPPDKGTRARQIKDYRRGLVARSGVSIPPPAARPVKYRERRKPGPRRSMMNYQN
jgi:hypothetical protein